MALSSALLFGQSPQPEFEITADVFNTVVNGLNNGVVENSLHLIPVMSYARIGMAYERIIDEPNFTLHFVYINSGFRYFLFKNEDGVRQIITDLDVTRIYSINSVNPAMGIW